MPTILADKGIICENYPEGVPFPGEKPAKAQKSKGVNDLSKLDVSRILDAFEDPYYPLVLKKAPADQKSKSIIMVSFPCIILTRSSGSLTASRLPVILGVPPDPSSTRLFGQRKFANGNVDHNGPPRLAVIPVKTSVKIKPKKETTLPDSPTVVPGSSSNESVEEMSSSSPTPSPRMTRSGAQKKGLLGVCPNKKRAKDTDSEN
jgi:hypothetical protein